MTRILDRLDPIIDRYDVFIVDQWGCLHDGHAAHPGAVDALRALRATGRPVLLVSNSGRPAAPSVDILRSLGFGDDLYDGMFTAGGLARVWLEAAHRAGRVGSAWSLLSPPEPSSVLGAVDIPLASSPEEADVLVVSGITFDPVDRHDAVLRTAVERGTPLLCINPDRVSLQPDGSYALCPGTFAARYASMGGEVREWGKPGREIYAAALAMAPGWRRGLAIGDSLEHDIAGGAGAGLDTLLVTRGIHWPEVADLPTGPPDAVRLARLCAGVGVTPTYAMPVVRA